MIAPARAENNGRSPILPLLLLLALLAGGVWLWRGVLSQPDSEPQTSLQDLAIGDMTAVPAATEQGTAQDAPGQAVIAAVNPTETPVPLPPTAEAADGTGGSGISLPVLPTASIVAVTETPVTGGSGSGSVAQAAECSSPDWWVPYVVESGDNLQDLAVVRGLAVEDVLQGNCLADARLSAGQIVLLPPLATVIGILPTAPVIFPTRVPGQIVVIATQTPVIVPSPTPLPTEVTVIDPGELPTNEPPRPTATAVNVPTRVPPTATPPAVAPTATPAPPGPTATLPSVVPTATPPFERPTQTPPSARP